MMDSKPKTQEELISENKTLREALQRFIPIKPIMGEAVEQGKQVFFQTNHAQQYIRFNELAEMRKLAYNE